MSDVIKWTHDSLAEDLAGHLKAPDTLVWTDMQLGPAGSPRPDVFLMAKSFAHPYMMVYECKVSRSDFLADVTSGKWVSYLKYAYGVIFAVPAGLVSKKEIPDKCGLLYRYENVWRAAKRATIEPHPIPEEAWRKLLIDGLQREGPVARQKHWSTWDATSKFNKKFGAEAARLVYDAVGIQDRVDQAEATIQTMYEAAHKQVERIRASAISDMPRMWNSLAQILGLPENAQSYEISNAISKLRNLRDDRPQIALGKVLDMLDRIVANHRCYTKTEEPDTEEPALLPVRGAGDQVEDAPIPDPTLVL